MNLKEFIKYLGELVLKITGFFILAVILAMGAFTVFNSLYMRY